MCIRQDALELSKQSGKPDAMESLSKIDKISRLILLTPKKVPRKFLVQIPIDFHTRQVFVVNKLFYLLSCVVQLLVF